MRMTSEEPKRTAGQKRAIFKAQFGELLLRHDFQFCRGCFLRLHEGEVLLSVRLELSRTGEGNVRIGGMPLCAGVFDEKMGFGESLAALLPSGENDGSFEMRLERQAELFTRRIAEDFLSIDGIAALLDYQERVLEDTFGRMNVDWAFWESVCLRDYDRAKRYALLWQKLLADAAEIAYRQEKAAIMAMDLAECERKRKLRDFAYRRKCLCHKLYHAQRMLHLADIGEYRLLREMAQRNIELSGAAFHKSYPEYK